MPMHPWGPLDLTLNDLQRLNSRSIFSHLISCKAAELGHALLDHEYTIVLDTSGRVNATVNYP